MRRPAKITKSEILLLAATVLFAVLVTGIHLASLAGPDRGRYTVTARQSVPQQLPEDGLININTASAQALQRLPGIGETLAERIVAEREANGPYADIWDLTRVSGIGEKTVRAIAPYVTTGEEKTGEEMTAHEDPGGR